MNPTEIVPADARWWVSRPGSDVITIVAVVALGLTLGWVVGPVGDDWVCTLSLSPALAGSAVALDGAGRLVAVARPDGSVRVWSVLRGEMLWEFPTGRQPTAVAVSQAEDGVGVAAAVGFKDEAALLLLWNGRMEERALGQETRGAVALAFGRKEHGMGSSVGGQRPASAVDRLRLVCWQGETLSAWTVPGGDRLGAVEVHEDAAKGAWLRFVLDGVQVFPKTDEGTQIAGMFVAPAQPVLWAGDSSLRCSDERGFTTALHVYVPHQHWLHASSPDGRAMGGETVVMQPHDLGRPRQSSAFSVTFAPALAPGVNTLAFDGDIRHAACVAADGSAYLFRRGETQADGGIAWLPFGLQRLWLAWTGEVLLLVGLAALATWELVARRARSRRAAAERQAEIAAALRLGADDRKPPADLRAIAYLLAASAVIGIGESAFLLRYDVAAIPLVAVLNAFAAFGLMKYRSGWRRFVLFELWAVLFLLGAAAGWLLRPGPPPVVRPVWGGVWNVPEAVLWLALAAAAAVALWMHFTLVRFRARVLFMAATAPPAPTMQPSPPTPDV
jgi:hypothetical protein